MRWRPTIGATLEADPRHAQVLIRDLTTANDKPVTTPMAKDSKIESEDEKRRDILDKWKQRQDGMDDDDYNCRRDPFLEAQDGTRYR